MSATTRSVDGATVPPAGDYVIDAAHTHLGFIVRHLMFAKVRGQFRTFSGAVHIDEDPLKSSVEVTIDPSSIDTSEKQRDDHLRSPDFFDVATYPEWTYRSRSVKHEGGDRWAVEGDFTAHGVTQPVALDLTLEGVAADPWGNQRAIFSARAEINREAFGLTYNQALEAGGVVVGKDIKLEIEAETVRQES